MKHHHEGMREQIPNRPFHGWALASSKGHRYGARRPEVDQRSSDAMQGPRRACPKNRLYERHPGKCEHGLNIRCQMLIVLGATC